MAAAFRRLLTIGEISRLLGVELHRVEYIVRARGIRPVERAGRLRVFSQEDANRIAVELGTSFTEEV